MKPNSALAQLFYELINVGFNPDEIERAVHAAIANHRTGEGALFDGRVEWSNRLAALVADEDRPVSLSFTGLSLANYLRCEETFHGPGGIGEWSPLEWAGAMCGEAGEAANKAKKLKRGADGHARLGKPFNADKLADEVAEECADTVIYADLVCTAVGRSLARAVIKKFNEVSDEVGSARKL